MLSTAILAAILNYENCSMIQKMYQAFSVYRVYWLSESVERKTISTKSTYIGQTAWLTMKTCHINVKKLASVQFALKQLSLPSNLSICLLPDSLVVVSVVKKLGSASSVKLRNWAISIARILKNKAGFSYPSIWGELWMFEQIFCQEESQQTQSRPWTNNLTFG